MSDLPMNQSSLFGNEDGNEEVQASIPGLVYQPEFLSLEEERDLISLIRTLPLRDRVAAWQGVAAESLVHALVRNMRLARHWGGIGMCRIYGVSLVSEATLRFRPYLYRAEAPQMIPQVLRWKLR